MLHKEEVIEDDIFERPWITLVYLRRLMGIAVRLIDFKLIPSGYPIDERTDLDMSTAPVQSFKEVDPTIFYESLVILYQETVKAGYIGTVYFSENMDTFLLRLYHTVSGKIFEKLLVKE